MCINRSVLFEKKIEEFIAQQQQIRYKMPEV